MIVPGEGAIRAMAVSHDAGDGPAFQQGTTSMPYTLAAALAAGMRYGDGFAVSDEYQAQGYATVKNCAGQGAAEPTVVIHNREKGGKRFVTLRSGTRGAVNTFNMRVQEKVGLCETVRMAEGLGLRSADGKPLRETETFTLGLTEADPVSVANSYATLAARGRFCEPVVITEIRDGSGTTRSFPPQCRQVLDPAVADAVTGVLSDVLAKSRLKGIGREAAGMPGEGDEHRSAWYAGYTPDLAAAVSLGDPRGAYRYPLVDVTMAGRHYRQVGGTSVPGLIWKQAMTEAARGTRETRFARPGHAALRRLPRRLPELTAARAALRNSGKAGGLRVAQALAVTDEWRGSQFSTSLAFHYLQQPAHGMGERDGFLFDPAERGGACGRDGVVRDALGFGEVREVRR